MNQNKPCPIQTLLVPLDGSHLAEATIPPAMLLGAKFKAKIILLHIREQNAPATVHGDKHLLSVDDANVYLQDMTDKLHDAGLTVEWHVHEPLEGDVARSIVQHANEFSPDLVLLCAHGSGGVRDLLYGSIAQQTLKQGKWPILLLQPSEHGNPPAFDPKNILVPLDFEHTHDPSLTFASTLSAAFKASLHLVAVIPTLQTLSGDRSVTGTMLPTTTRAVLDMAEQESKDHIEQMADLCRSDELDIHTKVLRGDPVQAVLDYASKIHADMVVLSSHGKVGLNAILSGSVGPRIASRLARPILLVKAKQNE
jgi:nucleotide-binding universal stress UspA family protein